MSANNQILIKKHKGRWYVFDNVMAESWSEKNELSEKSAEGEDFEKRFDEICNFKTGISVRKIKDSIRSEKKKSEEIGRKQINDINEKEIGKLAKEEMRKELLKEFFPEHGVIDVEKFPDKVFNYLSKIK